MDRAQDRDFRPAASYGRKIPPTVASLQHAAQITSAPCIFNVEAMAQTPAVGY